MHRGWKNQYFQTVNMYLPYFWGRLEAKYKASHDNLKNFAVKLELLSIFMLLGIRDIRVASNREAGEGWAERSCCYPPESVRLLSSAPQKVRPHWLREKKMRGWAGAATGGTGFVWQWEQDTRPRAPGPKRGEAKKQPWRVVLASAWLSQCGDSSNILSGFDFQREGKLQCRWFF